MKETHDNNAKADLVQNAAQSTSSKRRTILKKELLQDFYAQFPMLTKEDVDEVFNSFLEVLQEAFDNDEKIELRGFGKFEPKYYNGKKVGTKFKSFVQFDKTT